jgi:hypothetical protein
MTEDMARLDWIEDGFTCIKESCPACGADPGVPCTDVSTPQALAAPLYLSYPHPERVEMLAMLAGDGNELTITQFDDAVERTGLL